MDLGEAARAAINSRNYNFVRTVDVAVSYKSQPFYVSFGKKDEIIGNLAFLSDEGDSYIEKISVSFFLDPEKLLKCTIISIPECVNEMDSLFYAITFEGNIAVKYNCEFMGGEAYCLRKNGEHICKLFDKAPTAEEIWEVIQKEAPCPQTGQLMSLLLAEDNEWFFMLFNEHDEKLLTHWLGTPEFKKEIFEKDGVEYALITGEKPARYLLRFNSAQYKLEGVQYADIAVAEAL